MASQLLEKLFQNNPHLNEIQKDQIQETLSYLEKHKISLLFEVTFEIIYKELLSQLIFEMSNQPRKTLLDALKNHKNQQFFDTTDYEVIFEHFDTFNDKTVKINSIIQGLQIIGITKSEEELNQKYTAILKKGFVNKNEFVDILKDEYSSR
ncbi:unnamed protein product (macronuclear) [Paramecium tetraurelia]|uniref:EF-hand domain-containing protein n=1 Tax=Paramecium tetraurelia TaxID=5888 RepID=A0D3L3_PARTE|nr:uncharacterized protein GSPATT00013118001 [Paramecium tetraurelia]CAK77630.1 unnamed protein product [Paramecium tetraurelia]|eukprot:XP_001445027.1 hypothetical protein (macronuclear) [Paramecium tetraurelia strain d4-2]